MLLFSFAIIAIVLIYLYNSIMEKESETIGWKRNEDGTFADGNIGGGRTPETEQDKIIKKATKQLIAEYKEALGESLPLIKPVLIAKALEGDISAIKEIHDRVMDKAKQPTDVTTNGKDLPQPILGGITYENKTTNS